MYDGSSSIGGMGKGDRENFYSGRGSRRKENWDVLFDG